MELQKISKSKKLAKTLNCIEMKKRRNIWRSLYLITGILIVLTYACKKEKPPNSDLLTAVKWKVDDFCGPVGDPYIWTFDQNGVLVQDDGHGGLSYSTWSLKDNNGVIIFGGLSEEKIIS
jgi:hypothetical protein